MQKKPAAQFFLLQSRYWVVIQKKMLYLKKKIQQQLQNSYDNCQQPHISSVADCMSKKKPRHQKG